MQRPQNLRVIVILVIWTISIAIMLYGENYGYSFLFKKNDPSTVIFKIADHFTAVTHPTVTANLSQPATVPANPAVNKDVQMSRDYLRKAFNEFDKQLSTHWLRIIEHYIQLPVDYGYGSHQLVLLAALMLTSGGPIMELGCGYFSTVLLHQIAVLEQNRYFLSADTDRKWMSKFKNNMSSSLHEFRHIRDTPEWSTVGTSHPRWSIALIDHKPGERRVIDLIRVSNITDIVVLHDTGVASYGYDVGLAQYPHRYRYSYLATNTDVMSKYNATLFARIRQLLELTIQLKVPIQQPPI